MRGAFVKTQVIGCSAALRVTFMVFAGFSYAAPIAAWAQGTAPLYATASAEERAAMDASFAEAERIARQGKVAQAIKIVSPLAERGHPEAQYWMGSAYLNGGAGVAKDQERGRKLVLSSVRAGSPAGMNYLSGLYTVGLGFPKSAETAKFWAVEAARGGDKYAQHSVGAEYIDKDKGPVRPALTYYWMMRARENGLPADLTDVFFKAAGRTPDQPPLAELSPKLAGRSDPDMRTLMLARAAGDTAAEQAAATRLAARGMSPDRYLATMGMEEALAMTETQADKDMKALAAAAEAGDRAAAERLGLARSEGLSPGSPKAEAAFKDASRWLAAAGTPKALARLNALEAKFISPYDRAFPIMETSFQPPHADYYRHGFEVITSMGTTYGDNAGTCADTQLRESFVQVHIDPLEKNRFKVTFDYESCGKRSSFSFPARMVGRTLVREHYEYANLQAFTFLEDGMRAVQGNMHLVRGEFRYEPVQRSKLKGYKEFYTYLMPQPLSPADRSRMRQAALSHRGGDLLGDILRGVTGAFGATTNSVQREADARRQVEADLNRRYRAALATRQGVDGPDSGAGLATTTGAARPRSSDETSVATTLASRTSAVSASNGLSRSDGGAGDETNLNLALVAETVTSASQEPEKEEPVADAVNLRTSYAVVSFSNPRNAGCEQIYTRPFEVTYPEDQLSQTKQAVRYQFLDRLYRQDQETLRLIVHPDQTPDRGYTSFQPSREDAIARARQQSLLDLHPSCRGEGFNKEVFMGDFDLIPFDADKSLEGDAFGVPAERMSKIEAFLAGD